MLEEFGNFIVIEGGCYGADLLGKAGALKFGLECREYPAHWEEYGKKAGPIRNMEMISKEHPDMVVAFHSDLKNSKGTLNMVRLSQKNNIPVYVIE